MKNEKPNVKNKKFLFLSCAFTFLVFTFYFPAYADSQHLTILHFDDLHGHIEKAGRIAAKIKEIEKEDAKKCFQTIVLNGGDLISGTPVSSKFKGETEELFLNAVKIDAFVIGNHEFDFGLDNLKNHIKAYNFPVLSANIVEKETGKLFAKPFIIETKTVCNDTLKIGIFGISHPETSALTNKNNISNLKFTDPIKAAKTAMKEISGADIKIALTHEGVQNDINLAKKVRGIDVVVGGHDHVKPENYCKEINGVPVCQTPANGSYLGRIDLEIENGKVVNKKEELIPIDEKIRPDQGLESSLKPYLTEANKEMGEVIGFATKNYPHERKKRGNSELGMFIATIIKDYMNADFAMLNSGGIRVSLKKGKITRGEIEEILPFTNEVVKVSMTGKDLDRLFKNIDRNEKGMQVVGPINEKIDSKKKYTIATVDFLVSGGDGYKEFKKVKSVEKSGKYIKDVVISYIKKEKKI